MQASEIWDERVGILQVTDAVGSFVRVRVLVSGVDGPTVFDLRCEVREALVGFLQRRHPEALPRVRVEGGRQAAPNRSAAAVGQLPFDELDLGPTADEAPAERDSEATSTQGLFTGSIKAVQRAREFARHGDPEPTTGQHDPRT